MPQMNAAPAMSLAQQNAMNRQTVLNQSVNMLQPVNTQTIFPASQPTQTFQPNYVGIIKRFYLEISGVISNTSAVPVNLTPWGLANVISNLVYTDPNNNQRHNTNGIHLALVAMAKRRRPFACSFQTNQNNGNNLSNIINVAPATWGVFSAPQTIAAGATGNFRTVFEVPLAYSDSDLRGGVYSNLVNAVQNLQVTINQSPITANPADNTFAIYSGAAGAAGSITSATITLVQEYLDQLPRGANGVAILPGLDLSTIYQLKNTPQAGITANQNFATSYANFNSFVSTAALYNSNGTVMGNNTGSDINYWQLTAANLTAIWKYDPLFAAQKAREQLLCDLPAGAYYFDSRSAPILTNQFGNVQLFLNPLVGGPSATLQILWEYFASLNTAASGGSLAAS